MGIVLRKSVKTIVITYLAFALGYVNTLILYPLVLTKEEIGLVRILINVSFLFATFASLGSANIPLRFFPYFNNQKRKHNGFLFFILIIAFSGYLCFVVIYLLFKDIIAGYYSGNAPMLLSYYNLLIPFTAIALFSNVFDAYIVIQGKPIVPNIVKEFLTRFFTTISLLLLLYGLINFNSFVNLVICGYGLCLLILILYIKRNNVLFIKPDFSIFKSQYLKDMLIFGGFALMGNASGTIIANIDSLMLASYKGLAVTGVYTIAFFIAAIIEIPKRSISQAVIPLISESNKDNDIEKLEVLYKKSSLNQLIAGGLIFLVVWLNIENIFKIIPNGATFADGKWVVFWIGMGKLFDMATGVNQEILGTSRYYKIDLLFYTFLGVIGIISNLIFIPLYGINGAAFASAFSIFLFNSIRFFFILFVFKIQPFTFNTIKVAIPIILVFIINSFIKPFNHFLIELAVRTLLIIISFIIPIIYMHISEDITKIYNTGLQFIKSRFS